MKVNLPIVVGIIIIVVAITAFFLLRGEEAVTESAVVNVSPALATTLAPDMTLITTNNSKPQTVGSSTPIYVGDTLATSRTGRGLLQWTNGTTALLDYDTKLTLEENDRTGTHVRGSLGAGTIWTRVEKVFGKGEYYEIKTQNAVAVVRGTSFGISYKGGMTALHVATGTVNLIPVDPSTGEPLEGKEVLVSGGNKATLDDSGLVRVSPLTAADEQAPWQLYDVPEFKAHAPAPDTSQTTLLPSPPQTAPQIKSVPPEAIAPTTSPVSAVNEENACASFSEFQGSATGSALRLTSVSPLSVSQSGQNTVTLTGEGFICVTTITIGEKTLSGESDFVVASNSSITLSSGLLPVGIFDIVMNDSLGSTVTLLQAITITR